MSRRAGRTSNANREIVVDSFAGGGGASLGITWALGRAPDIAINHDKEAIALHAANHPESLHLAEDVWKVDPVEACAGRPVGLMWLSPDCKHFSKAKGGKPLSKKIRGLAWVAVRWARAVGPRVIVLENVEEFQQWGPLFSADHPNPKLRNRPDPARAGLSFRIFVGRLRGLGYKVEWRLLRACDYGTPTIRRRLFLIARCDGLPIVWPKPTHGKGHAHPWRTAAECIDWSLACPSIFERKKSLAENTLRRIARGIRRYVIENPQPFIVGVGGRAGQSPERPLTVPYQTITAKADAALVAPYLVPTAHSGDARAHSIEEPVRTITGGVRGDHALVAPYLVPMQHENRPTSVNEPLQTITTQGNKFNLVAPTLVQSGYGERDGQAPRSLDIQQPLGTVVGGGVKHALVSAFLAKHYGGHETDGTQLDLPMSTVTSTDHHALVTAHIAKHYGGRVGSSLDEPLHTVTAESVHHAVVTSHLQRDFGNSVGADLREPVPTITSGGGGHVAEVRAFLTTYYSAGHEEGASLFDPMRTVTSHDRFGLVTVQGMDYVIADIGMRMLSPRELYRAQGFGDSYRIDIQFRGKPLSKTAQVRMCGNSVPPQLARDIVAENYRGERLAEVA